MKRMNGLMPKAVLAALLWCGLALCCAGFLSVSAWQTYGEWKTLPPLDTDRITHPAVDYVEGYYIRTLVMASGLALVLGVPSLVMSATILGRRPILNRVCTVFLVSVLLLALYGIVALRGSDAAVHSWVAATWLMPWLLLLTPASRRYLGFLCYLT